MTLKTKGLVFTALLFLTLGVLFAPGRSSALETVPNVTPEMLSPDFWTAKLPDPESLIMGREAIEAFNRDILHTLPDLVYDLTSYPAFLDRNQLTELITRRPFPEEDRYSNGIKVDRLLRKPPSADEPARHQGAKQCYTCPDGAQNQHPDLPHCR